MKKFVIIAVTLFLLMNLIGYLSNPEESIDEKKKRANSTSSSTELSQ